jgi:hypothetical protein
MNNTKHYVDLFSEAVDKIMPQPSREISYVVSPVVAGFRTDATPDSKMMCSISSWLSEQSATKPWLLPLKLMLKLRHLSRRFQQS